MVLTHLKVFRIPDKEMLLSLERGQYVRINLHLARS
jgi:hypothetical protein